MAPVKDQRRLHNVRFALLAIGVTGAAMAFQATQDYPTGLFDIYPLYYGARAWL